MGPPKTRSAQTDSAVLSSTQSAIIPTTRGPTSTMPVSKQPPTEIETGDTVHSSGAAILAVIAKCKTALTSKIDFVATDVSFICQDLDKFRMRITEVEDQISGVEDQVRLDSRDLKVLQLQVCALQNWAIDTEDCLRRNNIQIIGLPERAEGSCPTAFTEKLLIDLFGLTDLPPTFVIEWAHRVPPAPLDREHHQVLFCSGSLIIGTGTTSWLQLGLSLTLCMRIKNFFFPDYSQEVQLRHKSFTEARRRLKDKGLKCSLLYPSKMRVIDGDNTLFF